MSEFSDTFTTLDNSVMIGISVVFVPWLKDLTLIITLLASKVFCDIFCGIRFYSFTFIL